MYLADDDVPLLVKHLDDDADLAWLTSAGPGAWQAQLRHGVLGRRNALWHVPSGPLPLLSGGTDEDALVPDPWRGWAERRAGRDPSVPYFLPET